MVKSPVRNANLGAVDVRNVVTSEVFGACLKPSILQAEQLRKELEEEERARKKEEEEKKRVSLFLSLSNRIS